MRGTRSHVGEDILLDGIIPAHAGNTCVTCPIWLRFRDHPRACGEHTPPSSRQPWYRGSSPRMRGTLLTLRRIVPHFGIIPAHAGNTAFQTASTRQTQDHPRACGEHQFSLYSVNRQPGSSPRMRGTLFCLATLADSRRIIPAHAGNTSSNAFDSTGIRDHPRACGEHWRVERLPPPLWGSSPRMRGTHERMGLDMMTNGIIPAHAGNTRPTRSIASRR